MTQNKILYAITGGIGSGKSLAIEILKNLNYPVFSCDEVCQKLYTSPFVKRKIKTLFPSAVTGKIFLKVDKKEIAKRAFSSKENYKKLTDYLTYLTFEKTMKKAKGKKGKVFVEVPLLFEFNMQDKFDKVLVIKRPIEFRIKSVMERNLSREEVEKRIKNQFDYDNKDLKKFTVIENDGTKEQLKEKILNAIK